MRDSPELQRYAALDCYLHLRLYHELKRCIAEGRSKGELPVTRFTHGQRVKLTYRKKIVAVGILEFVGGNAGESRSWGTLNVGRNKSLVRVNAVTSSTHRPVHPFNKTPEDSMDSWDNQESTLMAILCWLLEQLKLLLRRMRMGKNQLLDLTCGILIMMTMKCQILCQTRGQGSMGINSMCLIQCLPPSIHPQRCASH